MPPTGGAIGTPGGGGLFGRTPGGNIPGAGGIFTGGGNPPGLIDLLGFSVINDD